jgi:PAS domain S-box-containing protein
MVINSIGAIINIRGLHDSIENIMQANYRSVVAAQDMIVAIERQDSAELAYLNEKKEDGKNIFNENTIVFLKYLSRAEDNITEPGEFEIIEKINAYYTEYEKKYLSMISIQDNQERDAASKYYYLEILPLFESIKTECRNLLELNQNAMLTLQTQSKVMASQATISTTVISVATILFGLILAIYMSNKIVNPIQILIQKIKLISEGDYKQKLDISGDDEITELSKEFNVMTQKLNAYEILNIEKLMKEKHKSEAIIESINDGLIVTDEENKVLSINMAAERALGIKEKDVVNKHFLEVIKISEIFEVINRVKNGSVGEEYKRYSNVDIMADGITRHFRVNVTPIKTRDEETIGIVTLLQDITKLKEVDQLKSEFVSTVSHEFRTPLTSITMAVGLLLDKVPGEITEDQKELIEAIKEDSLRLTNLVIELLPEFRTFKSKNHFKR